MAAVAKWRDDVNGITTGGTSTAYTVSTSQSFDTLAHLDGAQFTIVPNATSGAAPTLSVDSLTAKSLRFYSGVAPPTGAFLSGTPYRVRYSNSNNEFLVVGLPANVSYPDTTDASSSSTGSLVTAGGVGIAKKLYVGTGVFSADGSAGTPAYNFGSDPDNGMYRIGTNNLGIAVNGAKEIDVATTGTTLTHALTVGSGFTMSAGAFSVPASAIADAALALPGSMKFIKAQSASSSATIDFVNGTASVVFDGTYDEYCFILDNVKPATDNVYLMIRVGTGGTPTYQTANYFHASRGFNSAGGGIENSSEADSGIPICSTASGSSIGNGSGRHLSGRAWVSKPAATDAPLVRFQTGTISSTPRLTISAGAGSYNPTSPGAITAIRFLMSSGNIASGNFYMYGYKLA